LTAVGKPYKLLLRADASRATVSTAFPGVPGITGIDVDIEDVAVRVTVAPADANNEGDVNRAPWTATPVALGIRATSL
jgi:fatty-acyl-CoA synthase